MKVLFFLTIICVLIVNTPCQASEDEQAWGSVINLAEALIGEGSFLDAEGAESKLDALIDLHVAFCTEMTGKRISSQRVAATKQGMRLFLKTAGNRYKGDKRKAILRLLRDLATNRAVFVEILTSDSPSEVIEQQMMAYLERNQGMSYKEPVPVSRQISVIQADTPLEIVKDGIRLISDSGTSGHYNKAIDAGEVITLNIPLRNISDSPFRSTSGFLQTQDKYVRVGNSEVLYTERSEVDGQTVTFAPGKSITPSQHFVFTLSPDCPDGHKIDFTLLAWDSDRGKHNIPFTVTVYHIGPLDFGNLKIDDDTPGPSIGNDNDVMEPGETIEYVLSLQNKGTVLVTDISASLFSSSPMINFKKGDDSLKYKKVEPDMEQPISSSFIFTLTQDEPKEYAQQIEKMIKEQEGGTDFNNTPKIHFSILMRGTARNHNYSWIQQRMHNVGVSDMFYDHILATAEKEIGNDNAIKAAKFLPHYMIKYRVASDSKARSILERATSQGMPAVATEKLKSISSQKTWRMRDIMSLLRQGGDINAIPGILIFAAKFGFADELPYLVEKGARVNSGNPTPLYYAITEKKPECVKKLVELGANADSYVYTHSNKHGTYAQHRPLYVAVTKGNLETVKALLQLKANPNLTSLNSNSKSWTTPLLAACSKRDNDGLEIMRVLIKAGANVDYVERRVRGFGRDDTVGSTALLNALPSPAVVKLLLDAGANPNLKGMSFSHGGYPYTPLKHAGKFTDNRYLEDKERSDYRKVVELLRNAGARKN